MERMSYRKLKNDRRKDDFDAGTGILGSGLSERAGVWGWHRQGYEGERRNISCLLPKSRRAHPGNQPIETTFELVEIIKEAIPAAARRKGGHPAKRTFQALRIAVNDELNVFDRALKDALDLLNSKGRISVITFHSLEDKICKYTFNDVTKLKDVPPGLPVIPEHLLPKYKLINKKAIVASDEELEMNHRAHSAKLRIIERV